MRIAFDVSPLSHRRSGIGTYLRGSLGGLAEAAAGEHEIVAFAPTSPRGKKVIPAALEGIPVTISPIPAFSHFWRQGWSRLATWWGVPGPWTSFFGLDVPPQTGYSRDDDPRSRSAAIPEWVQSRTRRMHTAKD
jgi:hypothetical protein